MNTLRAARLALALAALAVLATAPLARADYDPVGSGQTKLTLDPGFLALLKQNGVKLSAVAPASLRGNVVSFPADDGKFDPVAEQGTVEHEGALLFSAGKRRIPLKALKLRTTQKHSPFSAKIGGSQLKIATAKAITIARRGFGDRVAVSDLAISAKLATRLAKKLDRRGVFKAGIPLGKTATVVVPQSVTILARNRVTLTLAPGFLAKLESLFVAVNPIFPAEHQGPVFTLPVFGGELSTDASAGRLATSGSIELLQLGGGQVFWREPSLDLVGGVLDAEVDVEPSPPYAGKAGLLAVGPLVPTAAAKADPAARTIAVSGSALGLDPAMAQTFNEVFAKPQGKEGVFLAGEALGSVSFTAQGQ